MAAKFKLFGFKIGNDKEQDNKVLPSFAPPQLDDGAVTITASAHYATSIDLDSNYKNDVELITRYREMSMQPEIESAVEDIINEAIVQEGSLKPVRIILDEVECSDKVKKAIEGEFKNILTLLNFKNLGQDIFKRFYVDGRLFYNIILDKENPKNGIQELRYIDPRKLSKIREIVKEKDKETGFSITMGYTEYYVYSEAINVKSNLNNSGIKISPDSIISVNSGLLDAKRSIVLSYLHKAIKPLNQLRMIEDASVIYKISRAPERRIFYIDVGNLPKMKAEQYLKDIMTKYKNKVVYDACLDLDTMIPLLDGRNLPLRDIIKEYNNGAELWAYSCDPVTGKFEPGIISWAGITRLDEPVMKITLDNNEEIICTLDHKFPVWNKGFLEAHQLSVGESMIPFETDNGNIFKNDTQEFVKLEDEVNSWKEKHNVQNLNIQPNKECSTNAHTITKIEYLEETRNVGTLTIDRDEKYHDYHTFALSCGIYTKNSTGEVRDDRKNLSMMEDFWLPRRSDNRSTEITTLPSSAAFDDMSMVEYFEKKLYKALAVPYSRLQQGETIYNIGNASEISRDEVKFNKFVVKLRTKFSDLFDQALRVQCIAKGICNDREFDSYKQDIFYDFVTDNDYAELKDLEILQQRINLLSVVDVYKGVYYSNEWIRKNILQQDDEAIQKINSQIEAEIQENLYVDPKLAVVQQNQQELIQQEQGQSQDTGQE